LRTNLIYVLHNDIPVQLERNVCRHVFLYAGVVRAGVEARRVVVNVHDGDCDVDGGGGVAILAVGAIDFAGLMNQRRNDFVTDILHIIHF